MKVMVLVRIRNIECEDWLGSRNVGGNASVNDGFTDGLNRVA